MTIFSYFQLFLIPWKNSHIVRVIHVPFSIFCQEKCNTSNIKSIHVTYFTFCKRKMSYFLHIIHVTFSTFCQEKCHTSNIKFMLPSLTGTALTAWAGCLAGKTAPSSGILLVHSARPVVFLYTESKYCM